MTNATIHDGDGRTFRLYVELVILVVVAMVFFCQHASAQAPPFLIQRDGVTQFGANFLQHDPASPIYNFCETAAPCGGVIPPPPIIDPNAQTTIIGKFTNHACAQLSTATGQLFGSVFGASPGLPTIAAWPFRPQTSVAFQTQAGKYYGPLIVMPSNPGVTAHALKGDSYAGSCRPPIAPTTLPTTLRVVGIGDTPNPTGNACNGPFAFNGSPKWFKPSASPATDNPAMCNLRPGGTYRPIVESLDRRQAMYLLTWN